MSFLRATSFLLAGVVLSALSGCQAPVQTGTAVDPVRGETDVLAQDQPAEIAVAPVQNESPNVDAPVEAMRKALAKTLVDKLYSPLDLAYVDGNWIDASFRGTPAPDGLLVVSLTGWDTSRLVSVGRVEASADLLLFEGGSTSGRLLWRTTVKRSIDLGDGRGPPRGTFSFLVEKAIERFAADALSPLPVRDPVRAPRT
jgi:hypothetical protein